MTELAVPSGDIQKGKNDPKIKTQRSLKIRLTKEKVEILYTPNLGYAECFESLRAQCKNAVMPLDMWSIVSIAAPLPPEMPAPYSCGGDKVGMEKETAPVLS